MSERQRFTNEFKREAVRLWKSSGRPAAAVARELGLRRNHLYKWQTGWRPMARPRSLAKAAAPTVPMSSHDCGGRMRASARRVTL
jgi:transposase-like protein